MKISKRMAFAMTVALFAPAVSASAQIVGVQFVGTNNNAQATTSTAYTGTGYFGESFTDITGPLNGASLASQTVALGTSGVSFSLSGGTGYYAPKNNNGGSTTDFFDNALVLHGGSTTPNTTTFTFSGLTTGDSYDLALYSGDYGGANNDEPISFTVNGGSTLTGDQTTSTAFVVDNSVTSGVGNTLVVDNVVADSNGFITITATGGSTGSTGGYGEINGVSLSAATAPEPSTWMLSLAGLVALVTLNGKRMSKRNV